MKTLKDISETTMERLFSAALPLLTGLKYDIEIKKLQRRNHSFPIKMELEITESAHLQVNLENLKKAFDDFIAEENFEKRYSEE